MFCVVMLRYVMGCYRYISCEINRDIKTRAYVFVKINKCTYMAVIRVLWLFMSLSDTSRNSKRYLNGMRIHVYVNNIINSPYLSCSGIIDIYTK